MQALPTWDEYSPPVEAMAPTRTGTPVQADELIENVPVIDPGDNSILGYRSEMYQCTTTEFSMADTPEKIVMFSPDRELLWPGALLHGKSHRDGIGSLLPLTIRERAPIKVSIPSLANDDNFRLAESPDQAIVNQAIGPMISSATTANLVTPSTIQFFMEDYSSDESFALSAEHSKVLPEGKISVTSLGGTSKASVAMISSGNWRQYFTENAPLNSAYPISCTFRNLRDGSVAKVGESTEYDIKECSLKDTAFTGFILDSFETEDDFDGWGGYVHATHTNALSASNTFLYDVLYLVGPPHFLGDGADFYKGELSFWYKPDGTIHSSTAGTYCYTRWILFIPYTVCVPNLVQTTQPLDDGFEVYALDNVTTFDQVVLRGGTPPYSILTLTYNPLVTDIGPEWKRHGLSLTNDNAVNSQCDPAHPVKRGCWLAEDEVASEDKIRYVMAIIIDFRIRASYPAHRKFCQDDPPPTAEEQCVDEVLAPFGYVGGYFDEVKLNKKSAGF